MSAPTISAQPADQSIAVGATATFTVTADGTAPLTYQWAKSGTAIASATAATYTTPAVAAADDGAVFAVTVTNSAGSVTSSSAKLSVNASQPAAPSGAGTDVLTYKNDISRSALNATETILTTSNVKSASFGLKRKLSVDGKVDAQPLYLSQLTVGGAAHNVLVVATEHDSVYGFDADSGAQLWKTSLLASGETTSDTRGCGQVTPEIGITSTPVIDRGAGNGTIYVVAMSKSSSGYHQRLHALDATTGSATTPATEIGGMVTTSGGGSNAFEPGAYEERAALLLSGGYLYLSFTSHCDIPPYSGWIMSYKQSDLSQGGVLNVGPNSSSGPAIWMSGGGPAADSAGNVYLLTANGAFETTMDANGFPNKGDYGNSFVKISNTNGVLKIADYFALMNTVSLSAQDGDLGSGAAMLLPDVTDAGGTVRHLVVGAGKDGNLYVVNRDNMGKFSASANNIYQQLGGLGGVFSSPAYFNNMVYFGPINDSVKQYLISGGKLKAGAQTTTSFGFPGSAIAVSSNGTSQGIVWAHQMNGTSDATLHAYLAGDLTEIYNSSQASGNRDHFGVGNKFITPTIADGKVFVGTTNSVAVFGLL